ncbi:MFS transporter [Actinomadura sp. 7K507]|uniref:MFS transporter n=1 Tax=Actinomadura sp. 7K507 TaxID=2530365 RepID=UPI00104F6F82|nr:MFS transporter [Actinomadura sp. 7K507]TDC85686.1 MFS transporter [Actinomadura sp. 7K507]
MVPRHPDAPPPGPVARATVLAAATLTIMAAALIAPSLPAMEQAYAGAPGADVLVRLTLTVTSLAIAVSAPAAGLVADRCGRRPVLVSGLVLYTAAGTAALYVGDLRLLLVTRALLGVAVGGIMTAIGAMITDWFDGQRRARYLGLQQAFASAGGIVFLPLAGLLAELDYRAPAWTYAAAIVIVPFAVLAVPESRKARGPAPPVVRGRRVPAGVLPVYALALAATLMFFLAPTQLPFLLDDFGVGPAMTGLVIAGSTLAGTVGALAFPALRRRLGGPLISTASVALLSVGWLVIGGAGSTALVVTGLVVGGAGVGLAVPNLNLRLTELAPPERRGGVLSGLVTAVFLGQFLSPLAAQPLIEVSGVAGAFTWTGFAGAAAVIAAVPLLVRPSHRVKEEI